MPAPPVQFSKSVRIIGFTFLAFAFQCLAMSEHCCASSSRPGGLRRSIAEIHSCRQLIVVTTGSWNDANATVRLLERRQAGSTPWRKVGTSFPAVIGKCGFAWGLGLHGTGEPGTPTKQEGDQRSPAGVFKFFSVFGTASPEKVRFLRFPYEQVDVSTEAIDDARSRYYNRIVDRAAIARPDWSTSESMLSVPSQYRFGVMIEHNWSQVPGAGSCIFFHVWNRGRTGTAGCTAASLADVERLLHRLDANENPLIIQLPFPEYARLKGSWDLP
jgi:zinc D-Ala-D-Ala dipeptidase